MTPQQNRLYEWLLERIDDPVGPTFEQMRLAMGLKSKSGVARILNGLQERGYVTRQGNRQASVRALRRDSLDGVSTARLVQELQRRGEYPNVR